MVERTNNLDFFFSKDKASEFLEEQVQIKISKKNIADHK